MHDIPSAPPVIRPLPDGEERPLWSVMIPVYNCSEYLPETLESVLQQALARPDMQIEVVDDASSDADVAALVSRIGQGRITYFRQPRNVGSLRNFEACLNRARGKLVHLLHGDDKVRPGYYEKIGALLETYPEAGAAFCRFNTFDKERDIYLPKPEMPEAGILANWLLRIGEHQRIQYAAMTVRREVYEKLGAFYGMTYAEDWEMWVRIARHYPVAYTPEVLADYRRHTTSISGKMFVTGQYLQDLTRAMKMVEAHLPAAHRKAVLQKSRTYYANYGLKIAKRLWNASRNFSHVQANVKQVLKMHRSPRLYAKIGLLYLAITFKKQV
ncbi:glycosyltransferase family 2 protein [Pontibacter liquoris]|uniref:glycosyltransferase family 2 protein n=1 Tax=Pontibacter liquoris TaxID=2905677 RepID=UPI001FA7068F|nr:glycosyltransferase [Pontibacter liquoris]